MKNQFTVLKLPTLATGLYLYRTAEGVWKGGAVVLSRKGMHIKIVRQWEGDYDSKEFAESFPTAPPLALCLDGRGILHKTIPGESVLKPMPDLLHQVAPGVTLHDFCVQRHIGTDFASLSLLRQQALTEVIDNLEESQFKAIHLTLGSFAGAALLARLLPPSDSYTVQAGYVSFRLKDGRVAGVSVANLPGEGTVRVGDDTLPVQLVPAYEAALSILMGYAALPEAGAGRIASIKRKWQGTRQLWLAAVTMLVLFFCLLMVNFLVYTRLSQQQVSLEVQARSQSPRQQQLLRLAGELSRQEEFLKRTGWLTTSRISFLADRLGATVPAGIRLKELAVFPLDAQESKKKKTPVFKDIQLLVSGFCVETAVLEAWLKTLSQEAWIERLLPPDYHFGERKRQGEFTVIILVR